MDTAAPGPRPAVPPQPIDLGWGINEEENIVAYIDRAGAVLADISDDYEVIIIDDGSTDRTWEVMSAKQTTRPWLRLHRNDRNRGPGYNTKKAISLSQKDYLFWQTVDWSYDITELTRSLHLLQQYDVLQGVRLGTLSAPGMLKKRSDNAWKGFVSVANYRLIRFLFRLPFHDFQNVTVYPQLIQSVRLESESPFTNPECLLKTWWKAVYEIPVPFIKRQLGEAKGTHSDFCTPQRAIFSTGGFNRSFSAIAPQGARPSYGRESGQMTAAFAGRKILLRPQLVGSQMPKGIAPMTKENHRSGCIQSCGFSLDMPKT